MFRILLLAVLLLVSARSFADELTLAQKEELLDKAQASLLWFHTLGTEIVQQRTPPQKYREQITPLELVQAASVLIQQKQKEQTELAESLCFMLGYFQITPEECFEIQDILGDTDLTQLAGLENQTLKTIPVEAGHFRKELLNNAEKIVLYQEPANALDLMKAVDVLSITGRPVLVRHYLRSFLRGGQYTASPEESAKIVETIGTQKLMQLAINPDFVPLGKETVKKIIDEAKKHWQDEGKIAEALKENNWFTENTGSPQVKPEAKPSLQILWKGEQLSIPQTVKKLAEIEDEKEADELAAVLLSLSRDAKETLAAALQSDQRRLVFHAARGLAASLSPQEGFLLYQFLYNKNVSDADKETVTKIMKQRRIAIPGKEQAAAVLLERGIEYLEHRRPLRTDSDGNVSFWCWGWDDNRNSNGPNVHNVEQKSYPAPLAYLYFAFHYCDQACRVDKSQKNELIHLMTYIEFTEHSIIFRNKTAQTPVSDKYHIAIDPILLEQLLKVSIEKECFYAASFAVKKLGETENADLLKSPNGKPSSLVHAAISKDRRLRFAALQAIMSIKPAEPFAGSSLVAETLVWFSKSDGKRVIVSGHRQFAEANQTASMLMGSGYNTEIATTCREVFRLAAASPDVELVFVDARCPQPPVGEFVQTMRQDFRTAEIPIAVLTSAERDLDPRVNAFRRNTMEAIDRLKPDSPFRMSLSLNYPRITNGESAAWIRDDLIAKTGIEFVPPETRLKEAKWALDQIREIAERQQSSGGKVFHFDDLESVVLDALHSDVRIGQGLELASSVKSVRLQESLYNISANAVLPMDLRERSAEHFKRSVEMFGVLLRGEQVQRMYDRYNASESEPKESQELLSKLIDAVEKKTLEK